jgi:undecaprenyl diphosphate synthase
MKELLQQLRPGEADWLLANQLDPRRLPGHVAIIMDGNGRWAKQRNYPRILGHKAGISSVRTVVEASAQAGIRTLTLYAFSVENWKRPRHEVEGLWRLLRYYLRREVPNLMKNNVRLGTLGRVEALPLGARRELELSIERLSGNTGMRLNLAINYGGRTEIVDAVNRMLAAAKSAGKLDSLELSEASLAANLYTAGMDDPDLLIRTSGEMRVSNFLLWQIAYAELYVTDTLWPDFGRTELLQALLDFQSRDRRFGGLTADELRVDGSGADALTSLDGPSGLKSTRLESHQDEALELPLA